MSEVLNLAAYRFVELDDLPQLRARLFRDASELSLRGTVILAPEGINLCIAGAPTAAERWFDALCGDARFNAIAVKRSISAESPFRRLCVKIKREIIRMNTPAIAPGLGRAPSIDADTLARWLLHGRDEFGQAVVMLDTRNDFEVDAGAFAGALDWRLRRFSDFPHALAINGKDLRGKTVVSYCTGGIRCEKAALMLRAAGVERAFQLEGGILGYFEQTGGAAPGWRGHCFVFDERGTLDTRLRPAAAPRSTSTACHGARSKTSTSACRPCCKRSAASPSSMAASPAASGCPLTSSAPRAMCT
jgi:UPF0176 protein